MHEKLEGLRGPVSFQTSEQSTINTLLNEHKNIVWKYLPERYYTHGLYVEGIKNFSENDQTGLWWENKELEEKKNVFMPSDMLVHHANWANGIQNKIDLLRFIESKWNFRMSTKNGLKKGQLLTTGGRKR